MEPVETAKTVEAEVVSESAEHKTEAEAEVEVITEEKSRKKLNRKPKLPKKQNLLTNNN